MVLWLQTSGALIVIGGFLCSFFICWLSLFVILRLAPHIGLLDEPNQRKSHTRSVPLGGGIAIVVGVISGFGGSFLGGWASTDSLLPNLIAPFYEQDFWVIMLGAIAISIMGLVDDYKDLKPITKIIIESIVAIILISYDIRLTVFVDNYLFSAFITWFWILLITNAFNLLDNMDGLSSGVAFISGAIFMVVAAQTEQWGVALSLLILLGALLAFLTFNFPPAKMFMGDSGSLFIGYFMAVFTVYATFYQPVSHLSVFPVALPLLVMAIPLFDTFTVIWIRWSEKRSIFKADKKHFSHRLVSLGMTTRQAVLTIYFTTFACGIGATLLYQTNFFGGVIIVVQIIVILFIIHILEQTAANNEANI